MIKLNEDDVREELVEATKEIAGYFIEDGHFDDEQTRREKSTEIANKYDLGEDVLVDIEIAEDDSATIYISSKDESSGVFKVVTEANLTNYNDSDSPELNIRIDMESVDDIDSTEKDIENPEDINDTDVLSDHYDNDIEDEVAGTEEYDDYDDYYDDPVE